MNVMLSCALIHKSLIFFLSPCDYLASKIRYEITRGNHGGAFAVKNETGAIYVAGPLDYESRKEVCFIFSIYFLFLSFCFHSFFSVMQFANFTLILE